MCADILPFCHTRVSRNDSFAIRRVHRRHRGWPSSQRSPGSISMVQTECCSCCVVHYSLKNYPRHPQQMLWESCKLSFILQKVPWKWTKLSIHLIDKFENFPDCGNYFIIMLNVILNISLTARWKCWQPGRGALCFCCVAWAQFHRAA